MVIAVEQEFLKLNEAKRILPPKTTWCDAFPLRLYYWFEWFVEWLLLAVWDCWSSRLLLSRILFFCTVGLCSMKLSLVFCGLTFSFLSTRINISHLCRRYLDWRFAGMYNIVVLTMNSFLHLVDQDTLLIVCTVVLFVMYTWYVCTVITQIKRYLGIYALHLGSSQKSDWFVCFEYSLLESWGMSQYKLSCLKSYMIHSDIALMNLPVDTWLEMFSYIFSW